jgi:cytochrome c oxidase cbb3-type subunit 3
MPTDLDPDPIRPHAFDGDIREYDKRLPNWWLATFYGAIAFAIFYWVAYHVLPFGKDPGLALKAEMDENTQTASLKAGQIDDALLWKMSQQSSAVAAGQATYATNCVACHMPDLTGSIGPNLKDMEWIHGGQPMDLMQTVTTGVLAKGMPTWGPVLGQQKITEVVAFILSFHQQGEPIKIVAGWVPHAPGAPAVPAPAAATEPR